MENKLTTKKVDIYACLRCAFCYDFSKIGQYRMCPAFAGTEYESYTARGKMNLARAIVDGVVDYDEDIAKRIFACTECGACEANCLKYLDLSGVFMTMKEDLACLGIIPEGLKQAVESIIKEGNIYDKPQSERFNWLRDKSRVDGKSDTLFYVGCTPAYLRRQIARSSVTVLDKFGIDYMLTSKEMCCGHPFLAAGEIDKAKEIAEKTVTEFEKIGIKRIIFDCSGCLKMFKEDYPKLLGRDLPFDVLHISQVLTDYLREKAASFKSLPMKVTYHDPCTLGRHLEIYDDPRSIIKAIPGLELVEMPRNRKDGYCCGAGCLVKMHDNDLALKTGIERLQEAEATGAEAVISACPACQTNLLDAARQSGIQMKVMDITELLSQVL
ncbi:(Fe-S)-binding protein [bacterium]|nr:(Fe-S)-binding protein [bacterium]